MPERFLQTEFGWKRKKEELKKIRSNIFTEAFIALKSFFEDPLLILSTDPVLKKTDKTHQYPAMIEVFTLLSKYLIGSNIKNKLTIYQWGHDTISWIFFRVIDDLNSKHYEVKFACISYVSALFEGLNADIIKYLIHYYPVFNLYDLMVRFCKKIHMAVELKMNLSFLEQSREECCVDKWTENMIIIKNTKELINSYIYNYNTYTEHIVFKTISAIYILIMNISSKVGMFKFFIENKKKNIERYYNRRHGFDAKKIEDIRIFEFFTKIHANVEVVIKGDAKTQLVKIFFLKPQISFYITKDIKSSFFSTYNYKSKQGKHTNLIDYNKKQERYIKDFKINQRKNKRSKLFNSSKFLWWNQLFLFLLSFVLNCLMLYYLIISTNDILTNDIPTNDIPTNDIPTNFALFYGQDDTEVNYTTELFYKKTEGELVILIFAIFICYYSFLLLLLCILTNVKSIKNSEDFTKEVYLSKIGNYFKNLIQKRYFISYSLHFIFTLIGLISNEFFFYTLNLLLLATLSQVILFIGKAITRNIMKLLITLCVVIIVIFSYSYMAYFSLTAEDYGDNFPHVCDSFFTCFSNSVNLGLRLGGGLGDAFNIYGELKKDKTRFFGRFFFDVTFFIIIKLIFLNIISGIIIDAFSALRDDMNAREFEKNNICQICGLNREQLQAKKEPFKYHIENTHNIWYYMSFLTYIDNLKMEQASSNELYIKRKVDKKEMDWMPQNVFLPKGLNVKVLSNESAFIRESTGFKHKCDCEYCVTKQ